MRSIILLLSLLFITPIVAQDIHSLMTKYQDMVLGDELKKSDKLTNLVAVLEIKTPQGNFSGKLWVIDGLAYKIEMDGKEGTSYELINKNGVTKHTAKKAKDKKTEEELKMEMIEKEATKNPEQEMKELVRKQFLMEIRPLIKFSNPEKMGMVEVMPDEESEGERILIKERLELADIQNTYCVNQLTFHIEKISVMYNDNGEEKQEEYVYRNYKKFPEGYIYPTEFTTPYGIATIKSIKFNQKINSKELGLEFLPE